MLGYDDSVAAYALWASARPRVPGRVCPGNTPSATRLCRTTARRGKTATTGPAFRRANYRAAATAVWKRPPDGANRLELGMAQPKANSRPERMSQIQGTLDQLADEAATKIDPADLEE